MQTYEIMIIFDRDADEDGRQSIIDGFKQGVAERGGEIIHTDIWGLRTFAYEINHKNEGFYAIYEFTASGDVSELERPMQLSDAVVRQKILAIPEEEVERRIKEGREFKHNIKSPKSKHPKSPKPKSQEPETPTPEPETPTPESETPTPESETPEIPDIADTETNKEPVSFKSTP